MLKGPFEPSSLPQLHISRFGIIPKKATNKWRLICDLSSPEGYSINDGISEELSSLSYVSVDDAADRILALGQGSMLAKVDIRSAYRIIPVHPDDRHLLGMEWQGIVYIETALPFALRSAPKIFNAVADAAEWIVRAEGAQEILHYLDDFLLIGPPRSDSCATSLTKLLSVFDRLGIPIAEDKLEGPATCLVFLGIELDTLQMSLRLPIEKLQELRELVQTWLRRRFCSKKELQSLIGKLQHACKVVRAGRTFLRRMFALLSVADRSHHHIRLNVAFKSDLMWWHTSCPTGMGCPSFLIQATFLQMWRCTQMLQGVSVVELFGTRGGCKCFGLPPMLPFPLLIRGELNVIADAISRGNLSLLFSQVPAASRVPSGISPNLQSLLVLQLPDWTSVLWSQLFSSCFLLD